MNGLEKRLRITSLIALAAFILIVIYSIAPNATAITNEAATEIYGIDILGLTTNAKHLPSEQYAAH